MVLPRLSLSPGPRNGSASGSRMSTSFSDTPPLPVPRGVRGFLEGQRTSLAPANRGAKAEVRSSSSPRSARTVPSRSIGPKFAAYIVGHKVEELDASLGLQTFFLATFILGRGPSQQHLASPVRRDRRSQERSRRDRPRPVASQAMARTPSRALICRRAMAVVSRARPFDRAVRTRGSGPRIRVPPAPRQSVAWTKDLPEYLIVPI